MTPTKVETARVTIACVSFTSWNCSLFCYISFAI